ncbi:uncharacterized protein LOC142339917 [Convolutriloba macropyga]|uniref:uncharacterized protein LOC142339917 n=1 Tax=Convolutriloba macropyga TaxID=536237 RepID=UPI003F520FAD
MSIFYCLCIAVSVLFCSSSTVHGEESASNQLDSFVNVTRECLDFIIPGTLSKLSRSCLRRSNYFCLRRYYLQNNEISRSPAHDSERFELEKRMYESLIRRVFMAYNTFSHYVGDYSHGGCCRYQVKTYELKGYAFGLPAIEYFNRITDFSSELKQLIFIKAIYVPSLCVSMIQLLSFGKGDLMIKHNGDDDMQPFALQTSDNKFHVFHPHHLVDYLTFDWFKAHVICVEKPMICYDFPVNETMVNGS